MFSIKTGGALASAVALLAVSSTAFAAEAPAGARGAAVGSGDTVHCYGVNTCKGTADCATAAHQCKGQNSCKGQGFKAMSAKACLSADGVIGDLS